MTVTEALGLAPEALAALPAAERRALETEVAAWIRRDAQANPLVYYRVVNPNALRLHTSRAPRIGIQGGNKGGKTGTLLAELAIQMTGVIPRSLQAVYPREKAGRARRVRLIVTSLTSAWDINLKRKLQFFEWNGRPNGAGLVGDPATGHYGWIPQRFLLNGDWNQSWSEKHRVLTLVGGQTLQVMSHDQSLQDFNQGSFDLIVFDELPPEDLYRSQQLRVLETGGQILIGGTPSDERAVAVSAAWFFDQILAPGLAQSAPDEVDAIVLWTEQNRTLDQANIDFVAKGLTEEQRRARLHGEAIYLGGLIFPGFTIAPKTWCFRCGQVVRPSGGACPACGARDLTGYSHVWDEGDLAWPGPRDWPVVFYMDPHQSKPTSCAWYKVDPHDAWWQVLEAEVAGDAETVKDTCERLERDAGFDVVWRKGDPKITAQTNQFAKEYQGERFTIRRAFEEVGFDFLEANTNFTVARERLEQAFIPNPHTRAPRFRVHRDRCPKTAYQFTHFTWLETKSPTGKDQPGRHHSDFPACARYLAMDDPGWRDLQRWARTEPVSLRRRGPGSGLNRAVGW